MTRSATRRLASVAMFVLLCTCFFEPLAASASPAEHKKGDGVTPFTATYTFSMFPGTTYSKAATLNPLECLVPCAYDTYTMNVTQQTKIVVNVVDCCSTGDTICISPVPRAGRQLCATSPNSILLSFPSVAPGTVHFYVGYQSVIGTLPAGYSVVVTGSTP
jgi:hypothetical protein